MTSSLDTLNKQFSLSGTTFRLNVVEGEAKIPVIEISNRYANTRISLQGAHLLSWIAIDGQDVIWVSDDAIFASGKSIRGGIPICWPWFGAHDSDNTLPAHGFARTVLWEITNTKQLSTGETQITFQLDTKKLDEKYQLMWPQATLAQYRITIGKTLVLELTTFNNSEKAITIGQALHTYFKVDDVRNTVITGLEGKHYLDKALGFAPKRQTGEISINDEVDRVYLQTADDVIIDDTKRKIAIEKKGSLSTVIWNPWKFVAEKMGDLGEAGYLQMLCVESANASEDVVSISAGENHTLTVIYSTQSDSLK